MGPNLASLASREGAARCLGATPRANLNGATYQTGSPGMETRHSPRSTAQYHGVASLVRALRFHDASARVARQLCSGAWKTALGPVPIARPPALPKRRE